MRTASRMPQSAPKGPKSSREDPARPLRGRRRDVRVVMETAALLTGLMISNAGLTSVVDVFCRASKHGNLLSRTGLRRSFRAELELRQRIEAFARWRLELDESCCDAVPRASMSDKTVGGYIIRPNRDESNRIKPDSFVEAASALPRHHTLRSNTIWAIDEAILTARKMFSRSLVASAVRELVTRTVPETTLS